MNGNSYQRSAGVKKNRVFRAFQLPAWVTRPECAKGEKDKVKGSDPPGPDFPFIIIIMTMPMSDQVDDNCPFIWHKSEKVNLSLITNFENHYHFNVDNDYVNIVENDNDGRF